MNIYILDRVIEYDNDKRIIDNLFQEIDSFLENTNYFFDHLVIDDIEIYGDYYDYFIDNIRNIKEVRVISSTIKEFVENIMFSTIGYLNRAIPEIDSLSTEFYKAPRQDSWTKLAELLEGIIWIVNSFIAIDTNVRLKDLVSSYEEWNLYAKDIYSLQGLLGELEGAMENKDTVSIADILTYESIPLFQKMKEKLEGLLSGEVK